ncbi:hypothetical protein BH23THE1_BH23THE1_35740 [soil metagenome]
MLVTFIALILVFTFLGLAYYRLQKDANRIGGTISMAKAFWLTFALFNYLGLSLFLLIYMPSDTLGYFGLLVFVILILLRTVIQIIMMFGLLNWRPPYGIFSNILITIVLIVFLVMEVSVREFDSVQHFIIPLFIVKLMAMLLCDSYYAFVFYKIVGNATTGEQAVWFATDEDDRFEFINRLTYQLNILFIFVLAILSVLIIIAYG